MKDLILRYIEATQEYIENLEKEVDSLKEQNDFLMKRDNQLQMIEQNEILKTAIDDVTKKVNDNE